jgi:hypothetical protein
MFSRGAYFYVNHNITLDTQLIGVAILLLSEGTILL